MKRYLFLVLLLLGLSLLPAAVRVMSSVNRYRLGLDDQLQYTIKISSDEEFRISDPPAPRIDGFSYRNMFTRNSSQVRIVNFRRETEISKEYVYVYIPNREGKFKVPAQTIRISGRNYQTEAIELEVLRGVQSRGNTRSNSPTFTPFSDEFEDAQPDFRSGDEVFLLGIPEETSIYRGQPVIVSYYVYSSSQIGSFQLIEEQDFPGYGKSVYYQPDKLDAQRVQYGGKSYYRALIKRIALSPQSSGSIRIPRMHGSARLYNYGYLSRSVQSRDQSIIVLPLPEEGRPSDFSGAVGTFRVSDSIDRASINLGETLSYHLVIEGRGNFNQFSMPNLSSQGNIRVTNPQVIDNLEAGIQGKRTAIYTLVPRVTGNYQSPSLKFNWFDPQTASYKTFQSKSSEINVKPGTVFSQFSDLISKDKPRQLIGLISKNTYQDYHIFPRSIWYWLVIGLILAALAVSAIWAREKKLQLINPDRYKQKSSQRILKKHFKAATLAAESGSLDFYDLAEKALMDYLATRYRLSNRLSTAQKIEALREQNIADELLVKLESFLARSQEARFSPIGTDASQIKADLSILQTLVSLFNQALRNGA